MSPVLVLIHVGSGALALCAGTLALSVRKGYPLHRQAGKIFFISMLIMAALGTYGAWHKPEAISVLNGLLTLYLVATGWAIVRRKPREIRHFDFILLVAALAIAIGHVAFGVGAAQSLTGLKHGFPPEAYFIFGAVALLAAALDARMLIAGGLAGAHRVARHLWRMYFALFIATASLFLGQPQVFPERVRGTLILAAPVMLVVLSGLYWLARVLISDQYKGRKA